MRRNDGISSQQNSNFAKTLSSCHCQEEEEEEKKRLLLKDKSTNTTYAHLTSSDMVCNVSVMHVNSVKWVALSYLLIWLYCIILAACVGMNIHPQFQDSGIYSGGVSDVVIFCLHYIHVVFFSLYFGKVSLVNLVICAFMSIPSGVFNFYFLWRFFYMSLKCPDYAMCNVNELLFTSYHIVCSVFIPILDFAIWFVALHLYVKYKKNDTVIDFISSVVGDAFVKERDHNHTHSITNNTESFVVCTNFGQSEVLNFHPKTTIPRSRTIANPVFLE